MIPRKRIDIGWADLAGGALASLLPGDASRAAARVEAAWHTARGNLACLSVRSGFDALLSALQLPAGSEVLVSAVTIRDITRVIEAHGLVAVPVDIEPRTLAVSREALAGAWSRRTRMVIVAHLFGSRMPMREIVEFCNKNNVLLIEDCAQAYTGDGWRGDLSSDVCLFSFGPIKTATALGGAVMTFRDSALRERVRAVMTAWPLQPRLSYQVRLLKYAAIVLLACRPCYTLFAGFMSLLGLDRERVLAGAVRGFAGGDFFAKIRRRPCVPLLALLNRRIGHGAQASVARRSTRARQLAVLLADILPPGARPGELAAWHSHWVFPLVHPRTDALIEHLQSRGFDATRGASSMAVVQPRCADDGEVRGGSADARASRAEHLFAQLCYVPAHEGMDAGDIENLAAAIRDFEVDAGAPDLRAKNAVMR